VRQGASSRDSSLLDSVISIMCTVSSFAY